MFQSCNESAFLPPRGRFAVRAPRTRQFLWQSGLKFLCKQCEEISPQANVGTGRYFAVFAKHVHVIRRAVAWDDAETGRYEFDANIRRPIVLM